MPIVAETKRRNQSVFIRLTSVPQPRLPFQRQVAIGWRHSHDDSRIPRISDTHAGYPWM